MAGYSMYCVFVQEKFRRNQGQFVLVKAES